MALFEYTAYAKALKSILNLTTLYSKNEAYDVKCSIDVQTTGNNKVL